MDGILSQTAEYALRAVVWISSQATDGPIRASDVSEATDIPLPYASKILRRLVIAGILESRKGQGGGFSLALPVEEVSFRDVLVAVDAYPREDRCVFGWAECDASEPCPLHGTWSRLRDSFGEWASGTTLAEVHRGAGRRRRRTRC